MVSYQTFVSVVFEIADDDTEATAVMAQASQWWNSNKEMLSTATKAEARDLVKRTLER